VHSTNSGQAGHHCAQERGEAPKEYVDRAPALHAGEGPVEFLAVLLEHLERQESIAVVVTNGVSHRVANDGGEHDQHAQRHNIDAALARDDAGDDHCCLAGQDETDEERGFTKHQECHQAIDEWPGETVDLVQDERDD